MCLSHFSLCALPITLWPQILGGVVNRHCNCKIFTSNLCQQDRGTSGPHQQSPPHRSRLPRGRSGMGRRTIPDRSRTLDAPWQHLHQLQSARKPPNGLVVKHPPTHNLTHHHPTPCILSLFSPPSFKLIPLPRGGLWPKMVLPLQALSPGGLPPDILFSPRVVL